MSLSSSLGAMDSLPGKLRSLLVSSKNQLPNPLKDEVKLLIQDLQEARNLLVDLSGPEPPESMVKLWRNEVREMSYDLEDYIDKTTHPYSNQFEVEEFGTLVDLARDACKSYRRYHLGRLWPSNPSSIASEHGFVPKLNREAKYIVGIDDARHKLINWIRDDAEQQLKVVPILGPVGVGKTALAQEVYREIGGEYHCRAFVRASRMPDTRRLLRSIISQVQRRQRPPSGYTVQKLIDCVSEYLQHKRYFIVIDGLWETMSWDIVNSAFPRSTYCSRILITTDIEDVAFMCSDHQSDDIFLMEPFSRDYSAELLNNRLSGYKPELFEQLEENLEDIIRTCGGLPLSIISMARILASQPYNSQLWCQVKGCLSSRLRNNLTSEGMLKEIVGMSYDCLSHDLKICLLYLSMYPEGYTFLKADLLKQWTAEGFMSGIQENGNDVAESYFDELVSRGLIEPNHINFSDTVVSYTVHSTMFEVIRYKSTEENFTTVIDYSNNISDLSANVRRLSLRYSNAKYAAKPEGIPLSPVRSLIFYGLVECMPSVTEFEVLRVLNIEFWGDQEELDLSGISQLFQLRYVQITTDIAVKLPAKMNELKYLETLEIYARVTSVPQDIVHLPSLLHLCLHGEINLSDGINHLRSLRTLKYFDLSSNSEDNVWCLGQMTDLHDLHVTCFKATPDPLERNLIALASSMGKLGKLKSFVLAPDTSCSSIYSDCSSNISSLPICLQRLELLPPICIISRLPKWIGRLRELRIMKIVVRQLTRDDVDSIAELQKLIVFSLCVKQPSAERIVFKRAAFPVLKYFKFRCGVLCLAFQAQTMPSLRKLKVEFNAHSGDRYNDLLTGIENLLNIQEVAGRIGTVSGAEESDWMGAEAAFKDAIIRHSKVLAINVRRVDWVDEEICQLLDLPKDSKSSDMASGASSGKCLESQQSLTNTIPRELPAHFMKETTSDLSPERVLSRSAFGTVYKGTLAEGGMIAVKTLPDSSPVTEGKIFHTEVVVLCEQRHKGINEATAAAAAPSTSGLVSKWRPKDQMKTGCVALVLCLNISVDPPDVIKISPCARMECWIDPFSMAPPKALDCIGKTLHSQYERWQPKARYKLQLDPTVEEVKKLCNTCRKYARSERVLFHYNGHGVPKPTSNGEIWVFNKSYTQYIPLPITDLDSWLKTPSIYVFDCSEAGIIVKAFLERLDWSSTSFASPQKDCILLAACEAHQMLPQSEEFPADVFTACLTTPIKMALHWFCKRTLLRGSLDHSLIDQIPGRQNDRKTLLGELNWIFTAITDTIAWNVLPHDLFQRLFRQDLLVASLFRNFLLAERIMRSANCSPVSYPLLPPTDQHHMWDAWDMAAEICLSKLPELIADPNAEFQPSPFFTEQLTAFEVWLDHGSKDKKPPEQLPIVLQVLLSQSHRFRALVLLGRFLDMGPWAVDLALSVGIFPYVLKLLQTSAMELRQILVFIWTKILALDKSCQVDLVKDGGHAYFVRFLDSLDAYPEQRAMAAFVLAVIVDGHRTGQEACMNAGLIDVCLRHLQPENPHDSHTEPLILQWLCLCLGKLWEDFPDVQLLSLQTNTPEIVICLLSEPQPEVRAAAVFALGTLLDITSNGADDDSDDDEKVKAEINVVRSLLQISSDASPLVRSEVAIALTRFAMGHNKHLKSVAAEYWKPQSNSLLKSLPSLANISNPSNVYSPNNILQGSIGPVLRVGSDSSAAGRDGRISTSSPIATSSIMHGSPQSDDSSQHSDSGILLRENASNGGLGYTRSRPVDYVIYSQFISTMCSFAKDPYPRIAAIGRSALSLIGVEQVVMKNTRFNSGGAHRGETSASNFGMARSSSWLDMNSGSSLIKFRTPPVSPPQHDYLPGLRRVCSMEFGQHPVNSPDGLAYPLLSSTAAPSNAELSVLPQSTIYNWSCGHFSRPLLTGFDDNEEANARREERERVALDYIAKCQRSSACKMTSQIASWDTRFELGTKAALLLPFSPIVVAADENEQIRVWNYDDALPMNSYQNHNLSDRGLSKLLLINELDESLLLAASNDGNVRVWKNFAQKGGQKLVTAFSSVQGHRVAGRSIVIDWQQQSGYLYSSGDMSSILVWDLDKEQLLSTIQSSGDSAISSLSASQVCSGHFAAGFADGSVRLYDVRSPDRVVYMARPHAPRTEKVVGIGFQPGFDPYKIVSASQAGDIQFLDVRRAAEPYLTIEAHRGSLTALAVHRHAPVVASGSAKQMIKVFSLEGEQLTIIRYQPSFMGQRIGSVNCLSFHPYKSLLAAGAGDNALVSIYAEENYK